MNLIPWSDPETMLGRLHSEMNTLFDRIFQEPTGHPALTSSSAWLPMLDVIEDEKEIRVKAEVPGVDPKDLEISVLGNLLTLKGEKRDTLEEKKEHCCRIERRFGSFRRQVMLPTEVDAEKVAAEYDNGVLTIRMKKIPSEVPRRVPINIVKK